MQRPLCGHAEANLAETEKLLYGYSRNCLPEARPCRPPRHPNCMVQGSGDPVPDHSVSPVPCLHNSGDVCGGAGVGGSRESLGSCDEEGSCVSILPFLPLLPSDFPPTSCLLGRHQFPAPLCSSASCPSPMAFLTGWLLPQCPG